MSHLKLIPEDVIEAVEQKQTTNPGLQEHNKKAKQEEWLAVFERCLSVKIACERVGISPHGYRYWKKTDAEFLRELNRILADWQTELVSTSLAKAIGYVRKDDETNEIETDAYGTVIRYGNEPSLAKYFMDAMGVGAKDKSKSGGVTVIINESALLGRAGVEVKTPDGSISIGETESSAVRAMSDSIVDEQ